LISHGPSPEPTLSLGSDDPPTSSRRGLMGLDAIPEVPTWWSRCSPRTSPEASSTGRT